jgi:hypothetical protein
VPYCISAHRKTDKAFVVFVVFCCFKEPYIREFFLFPFQTLWRKHSTPHFFCLIITLMTSIVKHRKPCRWPRISLYSYLWFSIWLLWLPRPMSPFLKFNLYLTRNLIPFYQLIRSYSVHLPFNGSLKCGESMPGHVHLHILLDKITIRLIESFWELLRHLITCHSSSNQQSKWDRTTTLSL